MRSAVLSLLIVAALAGVGWLVLAAPAAIAPPVHVPTTREP
ncbi:hypothetical protein ACIP9H_40345 [Streptomyces sp. NPDC088732]